MYPGLYFTMFHVLYTIFMFPNSFYYKSYKNMIKSLQQLLRQRYNFYITNQLIINQA